MTVTVLNPQVKNLTVSPVNPYTATICMGDSTKLTAAATYTGDDISYTWEPITGLSNNTGTTVWAFPADTTTYEVTATTTKSGCTATSTATIKVNVNRPSVVLNEITATTNPICYNGNTTLNVTTNGTPKGTVSYKWSNGTDSVGNSGTLQITSLAATTTYTVTAKAQVGSCTSTDEKSIMVTVNEPSVTMLHMIDDTVCMGGTTTFTALTTDVNGVLSYSWKDAAN